MNCKFNGFTWIFYVLIKKMVLDTFFLPQISQIYTDVCIYLSVQICG